MTRVGRGPQARLPSGCPTARCSCPSRCSASSPFAPRSRRPRPTRKTLELPGRIIPDPNASGFVQASVSGRLSPPEGGFPRLGTIVKAGDVLAFVTPPFQAIDVSDMRQKAGELDQQISIVERRVARYEPLAKTGAVPKVTLDEAILELQGPAGAPRRARQDARRARAADRARVGHDRRGQRGCRADRRDQCDRLPDRRSVAAVGGGPDLQPSSRCAACHGAHRRRARR